MDVLVAYDVATASPAGQRRLRRVAQVCLAHGQRVQYSVFECELTEMQLEGMLFRLLEIINDEEDSLRVYRLREPRHQFVKIYGRRPEVDVHGPLVI